MVMRWVFRSKTTLPPEIGNLSQLTSLYLSANHLTTLFPETGNLSQLTALENVHAREKGITLVPVPWW